MIKEKLMKIKEKKKGRDKIGIRVNKKKWPRFSVKKNYF